MGQATARTLYDKAQAIIRAQDDDNRWMHTVKPTDRYVDQLDLFLIHHFDNHVHEPQVLEFNMRSRQHPPDLPFPVGTSLTLVTILCSSATGMMSP